MTMAAPDNTPSSLLPPNIFGAPSSSLTSSANPSNIFGAPSSSSEPLSSEHHSSIFGNSSFPPYSYSQAPGSLLQPSHMNFPIHFTAPTVNNLRMTPSHSDPSMPLPPAYGNESSLYSSAINTGTPSIIQYGGDSDMYSSSYASTSLHPYFQPNGMPPHAHGDFGMQGSDSRLESDMFPTSGQHLQPLPLIQCPSSPNSQMAHAASPFSQQSQAAPHDPGHGSLSTTSASDSCSQIAHVLMCYQQGGEDPDFVRKAIESLVKKLKDKRIELDALITAITSAGKQHTCCVTIQRSLDGRLQVAGRKGVPHVVYARIWRWPNVGKNELQKLPICCISSDNQDYICINPYHYERVVSSPIGNIDMNSLHLEPTIYSKQSLQQHSSAEYEMEPDWSMNMAGPMMQPQEHLPQEAQHHMRGLHDESLPMGHYGRNPEYWCSISYYELDSQIGDAFKVRRELLEVRVDGGMDPQGTRRGRFCVGALPNVHRSQKSERARMHIGKGVVLRQCSDGRVTIQTDCAKPVFIRSPFIEYQKEVPYGSYVQRLANDEKREMTIFDLRWAYAEMSEHTSSANAAAMEQARAVAGLPTTGLPQHTVHEAMVGTGVDEMKRTFCSVAFSFVKGWARPYPRQSLKECPCWVEVHLYRPLQLLDQLLKGNLMG